MQKPTPAPRAAHVTVPEINDSVDVVGNATNA
jgi:hypothetical protein